MTWTRLLLVLVCPLGLLASPVSAHHPSHGVITPLAENVSTLSGAEALAFDARSGDVFAKSLQDPLGAPVQLIRIHDRTLTRFTLPSNFQNSDLSGIALDPLTGGLLVEDEHFASPGTTIDSIDPQTMAIHPVFYVPWVTNPASNGTGQERFAPDPAHPEILYFWDSTVAELLKLDRVTGTLTDLLALDGSNIPGKHVSTAFNDVVMDPCSHTLLLTDGASNQILEVDPSTSPATVTVLPFHGITATPHAIAVDAKEGRIYVVLGFDSIYSAPREGGTLEPVASGFTFLTDLAISGRDGRQISLLAVDKTANTVFEVFPQRAEDPPHLDWNWRPGCGSQADLALVGRPSEP